MIFPTATTIAPGELGREAEERGFESLWFPEHSHIPASRLTPWGGGPGPLPDCYWSMYELFSALAAVAATTRRLTLGTSVCVVPQRDPILLAKQVTTLDHLSGGRFQFGVGYGWNREELEDHGISFADRRERTHEYLAALREIWGAQEAEFHGRYISFDPMWSQPKPLQSPHPPFVMGAEAGPRTAAYIAEHCHGWMPVGSPHLKAILKSGFEHLKAAFDARGRDLSTLEVSIFAAKASSATFDKLEALGVHRCLIWLPQGPRDDVLRALDAYGALLGR